MELRNGAVLTRWWCPARWPSSPPDRWRPGPADPLLRSSSQILFSEGGVLRFAAESPGRAGCSATASERGCLAPHLAGRRFSFSGSRPNGQFPTHWKHGASSPRSPSGQAAREQFFSTAASHRRLEPAAFSVAPTPAAAGRTEARHHHRGWNSLYRQGLSRNYTFGRGTQNHQ